MKEVDQDFSLQGYLCDEGVREVPQQMIGAWMHSTGNENPVYHAVLCRYKDLMKGLAFFSLVCFVSLCVYFNNTGHGILSGIFLVVLLLLVVFGRSTVLEVPGNPVCVQSFSRDLCLLVYCLMSESGQIGLDPLRNVLKLSKSERQASAQTALQKFATASKEGGLKQFEEMFYALKRLGVVEGDYRAYFK